MQIDRPTPSVSYPVQTSTNAPEGAREILAQSEKAYGFLPNLLGIMAEAPALLKGYRTLMDVFEETSLTPAERQTVLIERPAAELRRAAHRSGAPPRSTHFVFAT
jgi:hypothetical protein